KGNSPSPDQPSDERDHGGHARFRKQAHQSRRQFVITSVGATGALLTSGLWMPALAHRALEVPTLAHFVPGVTLKRGDLVCVKVRNTGTGKAEVHILTAASNYQQFRLETDTPIDEVDASDNYSFATMANGDLMAIKSRNTGTSGKAGVHIL